MLTKSTHMFIYQLFQLPLYSKAKGKNMKNSRIRLVQRVRFEQHNWVCKSNLTEEPSSNKQSIWICQVMYINVRPFFFNKFWHVTVISRLPCNPPRWYPECWKSVSPIILDGLAQNIISLHPDLGLSVFSHENYTVPADHEAMSRLVDGDRKHGLELDGVRRS